MATFLLSTSAGRARLGPAALLLAMVSLDCIRIVYRILLITVVDPYIMPIRQYNKVEVAYLLAF